MPLRAADTAPTEFQLWESSNEKRRALARAKDRVAQSQAHFHERFFLKIHKTFVIFG